MAMIAMASGMVALAGMAGTSRSTLAAPLPTPATGGPSGGQVGLGAGAHSYRLEQNGWLGLARWKESGTGMVVIMDIVGPDGRLADELMTQGVTTSNTTMEWTTTDTLGHDSSTATALSPTPAGCSCQSLEAGATILEGVACLLAPEACAVALGTGEGAKAECHDACNADPLQSPVPYCAGKSEFWATGTYAGQPQGEAVDDVDCNLPVQEIDMHQVLADATTRTNYAGGSNSCVTNTVSCENGWYWNNLQSGHCYYDIDNFDIWYSVGPDLNHTSGQSSSSEVCV